MLILFTDTDTDITPEMAREYDYHLISMPYSIGDKMTYPYVDFDKFDAHSFYEGLRGGILPTTSALNPDEYVKKSELEAILNSMLGGKSNEQSIPATKPAKSKITE